MKISFELNESDLQHFREVMEKAREANSDLSVEEIVENASQLLARVNASDASSFIRNRMNILETLIGMVVDTGWGLVEEDRDRVVQALSYFSDADDLIPDDIPGLGFLDDAIMIELVARELEHEIQAYRDFVVYRAAEQSRLGQTADGLDRADWLEERRVQLHSRMRRRRRRGRGSGGGGKSPFSLL
ncbi:MAG: YkvA family protein [Xanthomonadales bacterium]|nr:YkvA family protein [Xanthomonadales bacterium]